jgi:rSAM/selenodomain-associated transferase 1
LVIMVKQPIAGRVKTRLARGIGTVAATGVYRTMQSAVVARLANDRRWQTILAISPGTALRSPMLPASGARVCQGHGDLGDRMQRLVDALPPGPVVIIGTDIPAITTADIAAAFRGLGAHDAVFGPSDDGGYWLVGLKRLPRKDRVFANVRWSTANALADTRANLNSRRTAILRQLNDIDTVDDLTAQRLHAGRRILPCAMPLA